MPKSYCQLFDEVSPKRSVARTCISFLVLSEANNELVPFFLFFFFAIDRLFGYGYTAVFSRFVFIVLNEMLY